MMACFLRFSAFVPFSNLFWTFSFLHSFYPSSAEFDSLLNSFIFSVLLSQRGALAARLVLRFQKGYTALTLSDLLTAGPLNTHSIGDSKTPSGFNCYSQFCFLLTSSGFFCFQVHLVLSAFSSTDTNLMHVFWLLMLCSYVLIFWVLGDSL